MWKQREWYFEDRYADREYDRQMEEEARAYNRAQLDEARAYNRQEIDEARAYSRQALSQLVEDSQNAGFNPLTVLRGGGASSYNAGAGFTPLSSMALTASPPSPSSTPMFPPPVKRAVGGGSSGLGSAVSGIDDPCGCGREQASRRSASLHQRAARSRPRTCAEDQQ